MYATLRLHAGGRDVEVVVHDPDATDADLARALGLATPSSSRRLADLALRCGDQFPPGPAVASGAGVELAVVGGPDAGGRRPVRCGGPPVVVGRDDDADVVVDDLTVSRRHASVELDAGGAVHWRDLGSRNGTYLRHASVEVGVGASRLALRPIVDDRPTADATRPTGLGGTAPHNRPPRAALPATPDAVPAPVPPPAPGAALPLGVVTVLGPLAMAAVMVVVLGNPAFALLALLAPVLAVGNHLEGRRRQRTGGRRQAARWRADTDGFGAALREAAAMELARRRAIAPDPAEVLRRAEAPSTRLWERRPGHDDWLHLRVGVGSVPWSPPVADEVNGPRHPDLTAAVAAVALLPDSPVTVDLARGGVIGIVGDRVVALALARSLLCQAAVHHGPADLPTFVAGDELAVEDWDWAKWLPHVEDATGGPRRLAAGRDRADLLADTRLSAPVEGDGPTLLVVVDGDGLLSGRRAPLRRLLAGRAGPVAAVVVAPNLDRLPAACDAVVSVDAVGEAEVRWPGRGLRLDSVRLDGVGAGTARRFARAIARFEDPELDQPGAGLPDVVRLATLLGLDLPSADAVAARWSGGSKTGRLVVPLGVDAGGAVEVDLDRDGPHVLVAGTTGAGKSELLRSLVAGLAASADPEALTFVLVDFKGGSAFDACARLPHVVGLVTDLDAALAERALRCLDAELRHRERRLRDAGAPDLAAYRRSGRVGGGGPLPRLVVVVDEFATLRAELPDFVDALVGVAQRGRSLGVHLVLATQRPAGAVSDHIKANTNLRIALRVQEPSESSDVVDVPDAAALPRSRPGRACIRFGPGEVTTVQTALVTGRPGAAPGPVEIRPFTFGPAPMSPSLDLGGDAGAGPSDLDRVVAACVDAWAASGRPPPRRPWPDPLPDRLALDALAAVGPPPPGVLAVGLADDPDRQRQVVAAWRPSAGNLLVLGLARSGTTTTLLALAHALAAEHPPDRLHLFAVDHGAGGLGALDRLPHLAAALGATEVERQARLVGHLRAELDRRRSAAAPAERPVVVVLLDGVAAFLAAFDDHAGMEVVDAFHRIVADGPGVGIHVVLAADRLGAVPAALSATVAQRWIHRLADPMEAGAAGASAGGARLVPTLPAGRFVDGSTGLLVQVAVPGDGWPAAFDAIAARWPARRATPAAAAVRTLPARVELDAIGRLARFDDRPWTVPVGLADRDLAPVALPIHEGDHVLIAGPGRSGRTMALATIAAVVRAARPDAVLAAVVGRRSWLGSASWLEPAASVAVAVDAVLAGAHRGVPSFLVVDDADAVEDEGGAIARLLGADQADVHVVAAGRAEVLRTQYAHWTRLVRRSRLGLLLHPHPDLDGDLLGVVLPRGRPSTPTPGRGYLVVDGVPALVQVAAVAGSER